MRLPWLLGTALVLLPFTHASGETLEEALATVYATNPTIAAERAQLRSTDETLPQALAQRRPTVIGQGQVGITTESSSFGNSNVAGSNLAGVNTAGGQTLYPRGVSLSLDQPLWTGGRAGAAISQADYLIDAERANLFNVEESVLLQATTAYLDVVRDQALLEVARNNVKVLRTTLDQTRAQLDAGVATRTDLAQTEARLAQGIADQRQAEVNLATSRAAFQNTVGHMPGPLTAVPNVPGLPPNQAAAVDLALERNPQVLVAKANENAAGAGIDIARSELMPRLDLNAQIVHFNSERIKDVQRDSASVLATLTVPVYQAGAEYSRIRQAKESFGQNRNQIDVAKRQVVQSATAAWENLQAARARVRSFQSQIDANRIAYNGVVEEQRVGTRTVLDVLNAEQELFTSQVNLAQAQHDEAVSAYQVKALIGDMTAFALKLPVDLYNPRQHYDTVRDKWIGTSPGD
jgi:outer membrane protein